MIRQTTVAKLSPELRAKALDAFASLANAQRGRPEMMGGGGNPAANPHLWNATGLFTWTTEHLGDLSHRMAQRHCQDWRYGLEWVHEKVRRALRTFQNPYGFGREVEGNLRASYLYAEEKGKNPGPFEQWTADFKQGARAFAQAHAALVVYNRAQWLAREIAVALGELNYEGCEAKLAELYRHLESDWIEFASAVYVDGDRIVPYDEAMGERIVRESEGRRIVLRTPVRKADSPVAAFIKDFEAKTQFHPHPMIAPGARLLVFTPDDFVLLKVSPDLNDPNTTVSFDDINASRRGNGNATKALKWLCDLADQHGVKLKGLAKAYTQKSDRPDPTALKQKDLVAWYERNGFTRQRKYDGGVGILRLPNR